MATTKYPPALALDAAVTAIKEMYSEIKSRKAAINLLPKILKTKPNSSYFPARVAALQKFGFIEKLSDDFVELTDSAMQVINPVHEREDGAAIQAAFMRIDVLSVLLSEYPNYVLPSSAQLKEELMKSFDIPRETVNAWHDFVVASFREVARYYKQQVESAPSVQKVRVSSVASEYQNFELPSRKRFSFHLDDGHTVEDIDFIISFFELKKKVVGK